MKIQKRYQRQLSLPFLGEAGQKKLQKAKIAIVGAGGLGSAVGYYAAAAGVGSIRIIDSDDLEATNLNRQILYREQDLHASKALVASNRLNTFNSEIQIEGKQERITKSTIQDLLSGMDAIVDCLDTFESRFLLNSFSVQKHIPLFHGACNGMEGRVSVFQPPFTACFQCVHPDSPPMETNAPILGAIAGATGSLLSVEVIKFLAGSKDLLTGQMLVFDGLEQNWNKIKIEINPSCLICGGKS